MFIFTERRFLITKLIFCLSEQLAHVTAMTGSDHKGMLLCFFTPFLFGLKFEAKFQRIIDHIYIICYKCADHNIPAEVW